MEFKTILILGTNGKREFIIEHIKSLDDKIDNTRCMEIPEGCIKKLIGRELKEGEEVELK